MAGKRFVVVEQASTGLLDEFTAEAVGLDPDGNVPTNLIQGTHYAVLDGELGDHYLDGRVAIEPREPAGFDLRFFGVVPPVLIQSQIIEGN